MNNLDLENLAHSIVSLPGLISIKDKNSVYQVIAKDACAFFGIRSPDMTNGIMDCDLPCPASESAEQFIKLDQQTLLSEQPISTLDIQQYAKGWAGLLGERRLIKDNNHTISGLLLHSIDVSHTTLFHNFLHLLQMDNKRYFMKGKGKSYLLTKPQAPFHLTQRQEEILFYVVRGKTAKEIGRILGLSYRTVESYQDTLKNKLLCNSKFELIEKALDADYLWYVPQHMLQSSFKTLLS